MKVTSEKLPKSLLALDIELDRDQVEKGLDRRMVFYWYQGRGRIVASEYKAKLWMVMDALTKRRTDGALVRVITSTKDGEARARMRLVSFFHALYPQLKDFIPE